MQHSLGKLFYFFHSAFFSSSLNFFSSPFFLLTSAFESPKRTYIELRIIFLFMANLFLLCRTSQIHRHTHRIFFSLSLFARSLYYFFQDIDPCCTYAYVYDNPSFLLYIISLARSREFFSLFF